MTEIKQTGSLDLRSAKAAKDTAMENSDAINLTPFFSHGPVIADKYWSSTKDYYVVLEDGWGRYEKTTSSSAVAEDIGVLPQLTFEQGVGYTVLLEWRNFTGNGEIHLAPTTAGASNTNRQISISENSFAVSDISETSGSDRRFIACSLDADNADRLLVWRAYTLANSSLSIEIRVSIYKGQYYGGYRPYVDQSLIAGYSNLDDKIDSVGSDIHSFCPTSFDITDTRWYASPNTAAISKLDDTWYHFESDNTSGTSALSYYIVPRNWNLVEPGKPYTILLEIKNFSGVAITEANTLGYMQQYDGAQFWGNTTIKSLGRRSHNDDSTYIHANDFSDDRSMIFRMIKMSDSEHISDTAPYNGVCFRYRLYATAGYLTSYDFRISIYPGAYYGDYTPYLTNSTQSIISDVENNAAPKATAIKRTQRIYYRSNSSTKPTTPGTASANWVTQSGDADATWTTMHVSITSTHKYIYTCEQSETNAGVVGYTTVLRDNTITIIDGGTIITGTVNANAVDAESGTFSTANIPALTADHIKASVISAVNISNTGTIDANKINAANLSIGYSQITNPPSIPTQSSIEDAAKTATNYIAAGANGIKISDSNPGSATTYQQLTSTSTEFITNGISTLYIGSESNVSIVRVGSSTKGNIVLSGDGYVDVRSGSTIISHFGYESLYGEDDGTNPRVKSNYPYYTLGTRYNSPSYSFGGFSVTLGKDCVAEEWCSVAIGHNSWASGYRSIALGGHASGGGSISMCANSLASGGGSIAIGSNSQATSNCSVAIGCYAKATGSYSHAIGYYTEARGVRSIVGGDHSNAFADDSIAIGRYCKTESTANYSVALGYNSEAKSEYQTVIGKNNALDTNGTYAFIVGGGSTSSARTNIFTVDWSGNVVCNNLTCNSINKVNDIVMIDREYPPSGSPSNSATSLGVSIGGLYDRLYIEATDAAGNTKWVILKGPFVNGTTYQFNIAITGVDKDVGLVFRTKTFSITTSTLNVVRNGNGDYKYGRATLSNSGTFSWSYSNEVHITKVIGVRV